MADLLIRDLDAGLHARLTARAKLGRRSLEDEVRETLSRAVGLDHLEPGRETLLEVADRLFGPESGVDVDVPPRYEATCRSPVDFSGPEWDAYDR